MAHAPHRKDAMGPGLGVATFMRQLEERHRALRGSGGALARFPSGGSGMRFNPKAKLDPSQIIDLRQRHREWGQ